MSYTPLALVRVLPAKAARASGRRSALRGAVDGMESWRLARFNNRTHAWQSSTIGLITPKPRARKPAGPSDTAPAQRDGKRRGPAPPPRGGAGAARGAAAGRRTPARRRGRQRRARPRRSTRRSPSTPRRRRHSPPSSRRRRPHASTSLLRCIVAGHCRPPGWT